MISDLQLTWDTSLGGADLVLDTADLATDEGLRQAVLLSLFVDRRAEDGDVVEGEDRRGWWADGIGAEGDHWGSRIWLLARERPTATWIDRAKAYASEALAWLVEDGVASSVNVSAEIGTTTAGRTGAIEVKISRPRGTTAYRFAGPWAVEEAR